MKKKTAVIILGNRLNDDGTISNIQEERLKLALEIEEEFNPDYYILSGGPANEKVNKSEALSMYEYLVNIGFNKNKLILEDKSYSTIQNAKYSIPIVKKLGVDMVIVCTSAYHLANPIYKTMESFVNELKDSGIILMTYCK